MKLTDVEGLAKRIDALRAADRALLLARMLVRSGARLDGSVFRRIRGRLRTRDAKVLDRAADEAVRQVRRERARV